MNFISRTPATHMVDDNEYAMVEPPYRKGPIGAMPKSAKYHRDAKIQVQQAEVTNLTWNVEENSAVISYRVFEVYDNNLKLIFQTI